MNIDHILEELFAMTFHAGIKPGLERIEHLCEGLENPQQRYPVIHLAGTNGKGSTSAMIASILVEAGYKVGLYTSPHIRSFNERIRIGNELISNEDIARLALPLMESAKAVGGTFFEVTTAMAFQYFAERRVDVAVIETGLGGRLDATNVCMPLASVITSIDFDHMEYLGNTLPAIAGEKAGIIKEGAPAIVGSVDTTLRAVFERKADSCSTSIVFAEDVVGVEVDAIYPDLTMSIAVMKDDIRQYYVADLAGEHQAANIQTVMASLPAVRSVYFVDDEHVRGGLQHVRRNIGLRGRCELYRSSPRVVLDVSHNPGGIAALVRILLSSGMQAPFNIVFGVMSDKDADGMLSALLPLNATFYACGPQIPRSMPHTEVATRAIACGHVEVVDCASVAEATSRAVASGGTTIICGSFHVADEAVAYLDQHLTT
ncbi:MAG: bifunctional folylpolyglutamate synthase/dihydrofolate synthase [Ignavibacteria bacterium]|jgi:dihydrofolate synthase/folylpolyglutamate synthase